MSWCRDGSQTEGAEEGIWQGNGKCGAHCQPPGAVWVCRPYNRGAVVERVAQRSQNAGNDHGTVPAERFFAVFVH